jgi:hypothetical protein
MILVDTSVIADIFTQDPEWFPRSSAQIERAASQEAVAYAIVFAELAVKFEMPARVVLCLSAVASEQRRIPTIGPGCPYNLGNNAVATSVGLTRCGSRQKRFSILDKVSFYNCAPNAYSRALEHNDDVMALLKCPECGKEASSQARACPHCGFPLATSQQTASRPGDLPAKTASADSPTGEDAMRAQLKPAILICGAITIGICVLASLVYIATSNNNTANADRQPYAPEKAQEIPLTTAAPVASAPQENIRDLRTPITGAFGFVLGEQLDPSVYVTTDSNSAFGVRYGATTYAHSNTPFDDIEIDVLQDRRIISIDAAFFSPSAISNSGKHLDVRMAYSPLAISDFVRQTSSDVDGIYAALEEKYGPPTRVQSWDYEKEMFWQDDHRQVSLTLGRIRDKLQYLDLDLNAIYTEERRAAQTKAERETERQRKSEEIEKAESLRTNL